MKRILLIEDDADIALSLKYNLEKEGAFEVVDVRDGESGLTSALDHVPDLILLDLNLPGMDGLEVCRQVRRGKATSAVPIIMLTARADEASKVAGLDLGADDYVPKPFSVKEVLARVRAVLRRHDRAAADEPAFSDAPLLIDFAARRVRVAGREAVLTRREFDLLSDLVRNRGRVRTRERLLERVWGYTHPGETRTVDVHVRRLREKLGDEVQTRIETVVGVGYRYREAD
jgi:DNA-binding response OmpR family regulator